MNPTASRVKPPAQHRSAVSAFQNLGPPRIAPVGDRIASGSVAQHEAPSDSIRIIDQWWLFFVWRDGDAYDAEVLDDH